MLTITEENYLKALLHLSSGEKDHAGVGINQLADRLEVRPATVNNMVKKLRDKQLVEYERYGKINLTEEGRNLAVQVIRKHRLWETFLFTKLDFSWDEVHEVAEQLEHIQSEKLVEKLDKFLNYPRFDPHGDEIPSKNGAFRIKAKRTLADCVPGTFCEVISVKDNDTDFLQHVDSLGIGINSKVEVVSQFAFDGTLSLKVNNGNVSVSRKVAENIYVN